MYCVCHECPANCPFTSESEMIAKRAICGHDDDNNREKTCPTCKGLGYIPKIFGDETCPTCNGFKKV